MLLYGGLGLIIAGIISMFFGDKFQKDAEKLAKMKKQAPILVVVGVIFVALAFVIPTMLA